MNTTSLLRIKSLQVDGLFELFDHRVDLKLEERVTILHGPNGVGKTMLLRMVNALLDGKYSFFRQIPFRRFALTFTDETSIELTISVAKNAQGNEQRSVLDLHLLRNGKKIEGHNVSPNQDATTIAESIASRIPWVTRLEDDLWSDDREGSLLSAEEIVSLYEDEVPPPIRRKRSVADPDWLSDLRSNVSSHFIEAQRLLRVTAYTPRGYHPPRRRSVFTVLDYAQDLRSRINDTMARYGQQSQTLDQSFPQRLLTTRVAPLRADSLKQRMEELDAKRAKLKQIGLLDEPQGHPFDVTALDRLDEAQQSVMTLYVEDTAQKLAELDDLARRTRLLLDNVNRKFHHKQIRIDRERGLVAEGEQERPLALDKLSSGEQHELVLHYDLLFRVRPNTLVLIDEPELSLHVAWQKRFLPDLLEIVETAQFDALIATHSPFIIGDRSDLMIGLDSEHL